MDLLKFFLNSFFAVFTVMLSLSSSSVASLKDISFKDTLLYLEDHPSFNGQGVELKFSICDTEKQCKSVSDGVYLRDRLITLASALEPSVTKDDILLMLSGSDLRALGSSVIAYVTACEFQKVFFDLLIRDQKDFPIKNSFTHCK